MKFLNRTLLFIILFVISCALLLFVLIQIDPEQPFPVLSIKLNPLFLLFPVIFLLLFSIGTLMLRNIRRGILLGIFGIAFLLLRFFGYGDILFIAIVALILVLIEAFFFKRPRKKEHTASPEHKI